MRRISLSLALAFACLLVLAACGGKSKSSSSKSNTSNGSSAIAGAEVTPASATAFVSINSDSTGAQWKQAMQLLARVPSLQKSLDKSLSSSGIKLTDVEQALGTTTDFVELGTSAKPTEVILTNPKDPSQLKSMLAKGTGSNKSVDTEIGSWLAVADSQAALNQFKSAAAKGKLADSSAFKSAISSVSAESLVRAYFKGSVISASSLGSLSSNATVSKALKTAVSKNQLEWGTLAVSTVADGLTVDGIFKGKTSLANSSASLIDELPSSTSFAVDLNGKTLGLDKAVMNLRNNKKYGSQIPQIEAALGVKLDDLAALAGSEMSLYGTESGIGLLIKAPDAAKSKAMLDKAIALLGAQLNSTSKSVTVGGVKATALTLGTTTIYYGVADGNLFLATSADALPGSAKLSSEAGYAAAAKDLSIPASNAGVAYVDFDKVAKLAKSSSSTLKSLGTSSSSSNLSDLNGLSALLGYIAANGDKVELKAVLTVG